MRRHGARVSAPLAAAALLFLTALGQAAGATGASPTDVGAQTLMGLAVPAETAQWTPGQDPPPTIQAGIGPGSALRVGVGGAQYICSAAFLVRDAITAIYYLSTAGHCLVRDVDDPDPYNGHDDPDKVDNFVQICVAGCLNNALGIGTYVTLQPDGAYHPVAFAQSGGIGDDFGLIEIPSQYHDLLRPEMPQWGGPTGYDGGSTGKTIAHYGHGSLCCAVVGVVSRTPVDQARLAVSDGNDGESFSGIGHVTGGDSGSGAAVAILDAAGIAKGQGAAGVITHAIVYVGAPLFSGTVLLHGLEMAAAHTPIEGELVLEGDPLTAAPATSADVDIVSPQEGERFDNRAVVDVTGEANVTGLSGVRVEVSVNDPGFGAGNQLAVEGDAQWRATWDVGQYAWGTHTLYARLVRGGSVLAETNRTVVVDPEHTPGSSSGPGSSSQPPPPPTGKPAAPQSKSGTSAPTTAAQDADGRGVRGTTVTVPGLPLAWLAAGALAAAVMRRR